MKKLVAQYGCLLKKIMSTEIQVKADFNVSSHTYFKKGIYPNADSDYPIIVLKRDIGSSTIYWDLTPQEIDKFIGESVNLELELIGLAHEFGHHFSKFQDFENVKKEFDTDQASISWHYKSKLLGEEYHAWQRAWVELKQIGYTNHYLFFRISIRALLGYFLGYYISPLIVKIKEQVKK